MNTFKKYASLLAIVVGVILTSCVKDNESESVTKLRNSKVKLNEAQAALSTAQANAATLNAEAAKIQADAARLRAEGEYAIAQAQAARDRALTAADSAKAVVALEEAKKNLELKEKVIEQEIARIVVQMEEARITAEIQLENLRAQLKLAKSQADQRIVSELTRLIGNYTNELAMIQTLKNEIALQTLALTRTEAALTRALTVDSLEFVNEYVMGQESLLRYYGEQKDWNTGYLNQWQDYVQDPNAIKLAADKKEEIKKLEAGLRDTIFKRNEAKRKADAKREAYSVANTALRDYNQLLSDNYVSVWGWTSYVIHSEGFGTKMTFGGKEYDATVIAKKDGNRYYAGFSDAEKGFWTYSSEMNASGFTTGEIFVTCLYDVYYVWEVKVNAYWNTSSYDEEIVKSEVKRRIEAKKQKVAALKIDYDKYSAELATMLPSLNAAITAEQTADANYKTAQKATEQAKENMDKAEQVYRKALYDCEAKANPLRSDSLAVNTAKILYDGVKHFANLPGTEDSSRGTVGKYDDAVNKRNAANEKLLEAQTKLEGVKSEFHNVIIKVADAKTDLDNSEAELETFEDNLAILLKGSQADLQKKSDAAYAEYQVAWAEVDDLNSKYNTDLNKISALNSEVNQLELYYDASGNQIYYLESYIKDRIEYYTKEVARYQEYIDKVTDNLNDITKTDDYKASYNDYIRTVTNYKAQIEDIKVSIVAMTASIKVREAVAATYKANIDLLLAEEKES